MALIVDERKVRVRMAERGMRSLQDLMAESGLTYRTLGKLFDGGDFTSPTVERMAGALGCSPLDLLSDVAEPVPHAQAPAFAQA